jgi:hypothetical protein
VVLQQRLRFDVQRDAEHHDRMIGELEKVYTERDDALEKVKELVSAIGYDLLPREVQSFLLRQLS